MKTEELVDKYFNGETSAAEEKILRSYFTSGKVKEELKMYIPLFSYFEEEIKKEEEKRSVQISQPEKSRTLYLLRGIAASLLVLVIAGIGGLISRSNIRTCSGDYVVINGKCYTDPSLIQTYAFGALLDVATPVEDYFINMEEDETDIAIIQKQLSELKELFNDDL